MSLQMSDLFQSRIIQVYIKAEPLHPALMITVRLVL